MINGIIYLIVLVIFFHFFNQKNIDILGLKKTIVIIKAENDLINYNNNPKGIFKNYKNSGIGAGFFIDSNGLIQTVNHIIENKNINYKVIYKNKEYDAKIISRDEKNDLAKIKIDLKNTPFLKLQNKIDINEKILSFGIDTKNNEIIYNSGIILNKKIKLENYSNLIEISNPIKSGFSGGPILNSKNEVIGINFATLKEKSYGIDLTLIK